MKHIIFFLYVAVFGVVIYLAYSLYKNFKTLFPGVSTWWAGFFHLAAPGTQIPDTTESAGAKAATDGFNAVVNRGSQGFYNAALQQYAYDNQFDTSLQAQGTDGWPWTSYDAWKQAGDPHLPGEEAVSNDDHGVYHNDYT